MERHNVLFVFCTQNFQKSQSWNAKPQCHISSSAWFPLENMTWVIYAGKCLWAIEEGVGVPLGPCMMSWLVWAALVVTWPCCAQAVPGPQPWPCWRSARGRGGCCCSAKSHLRGKGRSWCCALYGMLGRTECVVRKASSWYCLEIICIGHLGAKIREENGLHFYSRSLKLYRDYVTVFMLTSDFFFFHRTGK